MQGRPGHALLPSQGLGTYQYINGTAHAVFLALVMHDGPVVQKILQKAADQEGKYFSRAGQVFMFPAMF